MERYEVSDLETGVHIGDTLRADHFREVISKVVEEDLHLEAQGATGHLLADPPEADDKQRLVPEIVAERHLAPSTRPDRLHCFRYPPREHEHEGHDQVRDGVHEDRSCQDFDLPPFSRLKVDVVQADAVVANDAEALGTGEEGIIDGGPVAEENAHRVPERKLYR